MVFMRQAGLIYATNITFSLQYFHKLLNYCIHMTDFRLNVIQILVIHLVLMLIAVTIQEMPTLTKQSTHVGTLLVEFYSNSCVGS